MNIAIFNPYNLLKPGGVQDHVRAQSEELMRRGHSVTIITPRPRKHHEKAPEGTIFMGVSARVRAQSSSVDISTAVDQDEVDTFFENNTFDVVHFHEPIVPFVGRQLIASCPYPTVATLHAALPETGIGRTLGSITPYFRSVLQHVDVLTRVSPAAGEYLSELLVDQEIFEVPNGVNLSQFKLSRKRDRATIVFIGRLEKRKGPKYLIKAVAEAKEYLPHIKLIIAGDGPDRKQLESLAEELELNDVEFLGYVSTEQKQSLLQRATLACYPAIYGESFGIVLLEAMATGAPIIAGNNPGYVSVLKERGQWGVIDPKNTDEFSRRIRLLLGDEELRTLMSTWGLEYVKQFDYSHIVTKYEEVYTYAIKKHR